MGEIGVSFLLGVTATMLVVELGNVWQRHQATERRRQAHRVLEQHGMRVRIYSPAIGPGIDDDELRQALSSSSLFDCVVLDQDDAVVGGLLPTTGDLRQLRLVVAND